MAKGGPRIGVTWVKRGDPISENYVRAVERAGAEAVWLSKGTGSWGEKLADIDGLLLTGGGDVSPERYGEPDGGKCELVDPQRDEAELEALDYCWELGLPILGICRGFQVINVALNGKLVQDIESGLSGALPHRSVEGVSRNHNVDVLPGTVLEEILGRSGAVHVNSRHHQGVVRENLAPGLRVSAVATDGIVEGIEVSGERFVVGVQCHPERDGEADAMVPVFAALVERARAR